MVVATVSPKGLNIIEPQRMSSKPAKISLHRAMNQFYDRDNAELRLGTRIDYEHTLMLLEEYINTFGSVLLRAGEVAPTLTRPKDGPASKRYDPASLAKFFRGFVLFFLQYKLNAPSSTKETFVRIVEEFIAWLQKKRYLPMDVETNFELLDAQCNHRAMQAANILGKAIKHSERSRKNMQNIHNGEPIYMVLRVKSGRLWFIYCAGKQYDEFGPVAVPLGVTDIVKPGWLIDCSFGKYDGRWQIDSVRRVMPL